jgi:hypothetical protein
MNGSVEKLRMGVDNVGGEAVVGPQTVRSYFLNHSVWVSEFIRPFA